MDSSKSLFQPKTSLGEVLRKVAPWIEAEGPGQYDNFRQEVGKVWNLYYDSYLTFSRLTEPNALAAATASWEDMAKRIPNASDTFLYGWSLFQDHLKSQHPHVVGLREAAQAVGTGSYDAFCQQYVQLVRQDSITKLTDQISKIRQHIWDSAMGHRGRVPLADYMAVLAYAWYAYPKVWQIYSEPSDDETRTSAAVAWIGAMALFEPGNLTQLLRSSYPHPRIALFKELAGLSANEVGLNELIRDATAEWRAYQPEA